MISGSIDPEAYPLQFPAGTDVPGSRDLRIRAWTRTPRVTTQLIRPSPIRVSTGIIDTYTYNFPTT